MWQPTHIQVTVQKAKGLLTKGKNGTNNCFVTIALGKEKYQTSIKEKAEPNVDWHEECELKIPDQGNRAELVLTCLHHNNLGIDEFLGQVTLPLNEMDVYDRPRSKWFKLESKPGKEKKNKERGELEARISFIVKSGSLTDLSKKEKHKSSIGQLASSVGGSLLSIGQIEKRKSIKKFAKSLGSKMHLHSKKKNKDGDDLSINGSYASIDTPNSSHNGSGRRYGQRAGEADPGVISEDEDEFVFDNLSHKSSGSSLNIARNSSVRNLTAPQNHLPRNPSPLLNNNKLAGGKKLPPRPPYHEDNDDDRIIDPELEAIENDFSVRARTLPPPSKPPRTPQFGTTAAAASATATTGSSSSTDEWESKLYGDHLKIGSSDSLKRRSWEPVPLPTALEETTAEAEKQEHSETESTEQEKPKAEEKQIRKSISTSSTSSSSSSDEAEEEVPEPAKAPVKESPSKTDLKLSLSASSGSEFNLLSPSEDDFQQFNASFAKYEQRNKSMIFDSDSAKSSIKSFIAEEAKPQRGPPQALPRLRPENNKEAELKKAAEEEAERKRQLEEAARRQRELAFEEEQCRHRAEEDARLEAELRLNEQRLREEEAAFQAEQEQQRQEEEERQRQREREAKRREEDQRLLNFAVRTPSREEVPELPSPTSVSTSTVESTPESSPKERNNATEARERRLGKFRFLNKRDKNEGDSNNSSPKSAERIIIGHERASLSQAERRAEISAALSKKYEGKSREELMLIANGMENEALLQRQRVKELEDYLDNLLLRVMETHPKILQNPYCRTTSAKSG